MKKFLIISALCSLISALSFAAPLFETIELFPSDPQNKPNYRIPSLILAPNGDVLAIVERRVNSIGDASDIDIVMRRSTDNGKKWGKIETLIDDGENTTTDISLLLDRETGRLFVFFLRDKKQFCYIHTDDSGKTWSPIVNIHKQVTQSHWDAAGLKSGVEPNMGTIPASKMKGSKTVRWDFNWKQRYGIGPGHAGVQIQKGPHKGRLLLAGRHREPEGKSLVTYTHIMYSDDHGKTWQLGPTKVIKNGSENQVIELADGTLMMNARNETPSYSPTNARRLVATSKDGGDTWPEVWFEESLPGLKCHAALFVYNYKDSPHNGLVLFANPASPHRSDEHPYGRYNMTIRWSTDNAALWSAGRPIYPFTASYPDIAVLSDGNIGVIYECGAPGSEKYWDKLHFARFNLEWLMSPARIPWNP